NEVLLYYPLYDSWSDTGRTLLKHYDRLEPEFKGTGFEACADSMLAWGNTFDYISDRQLRETRSASAKAPTERSDIIVTQGGTRYRTILLPDCRTISLEAFRNILRLAKAGATILVYKQLPSDVPGWFRWKERLDTLRQLVSQIHFKGVDAGNG